MPPSGANHTALRASERAGDDLDMAVDLALDVDLGVERESVTLSSGRRYELQAGDAVDRLVVRSRSGRVLLRVDVGERGPLLSFESAEVELRARNRLRLSAPELALEATNKLTVHCGGDVDERIGGDHHTRVQGNERLEAAALQLQANDDAVQVRAMNKIALDGEHIGLNDDPCPTPFDWSAIGGGQDSGAESPDTGANAPGEGGER
jgi:hypothetical protein